MFLIGPYMHSFPRYGKLHYDDPRLGSSIRTLCMARYRADQSLIISTRNSSIGNALFEFNRSPDFLEFALHILGFFFGHVLFDILWQAIDHVLCILQAEPGQFS